MHTNSEKSYNEVAKNLSSESEKWMKNVVMKNKVTKVMRNNEKFSNEKVAKSYRSSTEKSSYVKRKWLMLICQNVQKTLMVYGKLTSTNN